MGLLDVLYEPQTKYALDLILALIGVALSYLSDDLDGWEYTYKATDIRTGTLNWSMFTFYLILYFPQYWGSFEKLKFLSVVLVVFVLLTIGCWVAVGLGSGWRAHETISYITIYGGPLTLAMVSAIVFVFLDFFFYPVL